MISIYFRYFSLKFKDFFIGFFAIGKVWGSLPDTFPRGPPVPAPPGRRPTPSQPRHIPHLSDREVRGGHADFFTTLTVDYGAIR